MEVVLDEIRETVAEARDDRTASARTPPAGASGDAIAAASGATMTVALALAAGAGAGGLAAAAAAGPVAGAGTSSAAVAAIERIVPVPSTSIAPSSRKLT